jgi:hypothetical protein
MLIRSRMGVSADGYVATDDGLPTLVFMPGFQPRVSHGFPEFIQGCGAVVMGSRGSDADVHLVGGPRTIRAFQQVGALDRLELVVLPILLGTAATAIRPDLPRRIGRVGLRGGNAGIRSGPGVR